MQSGGLSTARLRRMHDVLSAYVDRGELPGFISLVARRGALHIDCVGYERDTIFRLASMSKPIAAVAALILVEEGAIRLADPVHDLLPELAGVRVLRSISSPLEDTVPATRPVMVRDLLTFTCGTGMVIAPPGTYPIQGAVDKAGIYPESEPLPPPEEFLRRLSTLPLMYQPGDVWMYNTGSDLLGILVSRAAGKPFGEFLRERVFEPLDMRDSGFWVQAEAIQRLPKAYSRDATTGDLKVEDEAAGGVFSLAPQFESGGGGLVATVDDFLRFAQMLLDHGVAPTGRILARTTVEAMTTDHLSREVKARTPWNPGWFDSYGWGFGVGIVTHRFDGASTPGAYGWTGGFGTTWRSDPAEDMVAILMTQVGQGVPEDRGLLRHFLTLAYAAIDD